MPASGYELFGPREGQGAGLRWDDPQYGRGEIEILQSVQDESVEYIVTIEGGDITINGKVNLSSSGGGTRVSWREDGDFGWNPLLGYTARRMEDTQAEAMRSSLSTLQERF